MFIRKRAGKLHRLNQECKAYSNATQSAAMQYDGHNGKTARVVFGRLKQTSPLCNEDATNQTYINEAANPLPVFTKE